ncbi:S-(hydroxymethyl)mycothiol dehydrogenase [Streptomyces boncukensis]|uniref:S-(Hydroxymethyl)mycothiol dehydrogenase n=1 Tax=Streptomyces boncukensis TaxID=2711219 RepID=A0A6G4WZA1_9ACTN|nr:S-(hydroxymethyl)mycothiol dehydrogenase [Streptomyces boncukensis]NGO70448.1 S-(hydroxymethyl)mycothiol dehydrogenase [Streptomyces boncukensis]
MPYEVRAVITMKKDAPAEVQTVLVPDPGPGDVLVAVQACGVCHTDLHYREGAVSDDFPFLLGHEAAGTVEAVGPGVTDPQPGDSVVLAWRAPCGRCRACRRGRPWYCFDSSNAGRPMTLLDSTPLTPALGIGAFAEKTLVAAGQAVRVDPAARPEAAGLIGCGIMAGYGAVVHTGGVAYGDTVAVIGCGGVGDAAIAAASLAGARRVIAVDLDDAKLDAAIQFGATHCVNSRGTDPVAAVRELTDGYGADLVVDAVGRADTFEQGFAMRDLAGTFVQAGVPGPQARLELPLLDVFARGGAVKPSWYGDCLPSRDFPVLIDLYLSGKLDLGAFVTETIALDDVESAFDRMLQGKVLRSVVTL